MLRVAKGGKVMVKEGEMAQGGERLSKVNWVAHTCEVGGSTKRSGWLRETK